MTLRVGKVARCFAFISLVLTLSHAIAAPDPAELSEPRFTPLSEADQPDRIFSFKNVIISSAALGAYRGGSDLVSNDQKLTGGVAENVATNVVSGANIISAGAFANSSGIPIVIQNSGANVLIQNATIINLQLR